MITSNSIDKQWTYQVIKTQQKNEVRMIPCVIFLVWFRLRDFATHVHIFNLKKNTFGCNPTQIASSNMFSLMGMLLQVVR